MFNSRKSSHVGARHPDHTARITPSLSVSVWQSHDSETGKVRMHWDVSRINSEDPNKSFKTLRVESLLEFPAFLAKVATGFAQTEAVGPKLRSELLQFAKDMELVTEQRNANGVAEDRGSEAAPIRF